MNYLAHALLTKDVDRHLIGNLLTDLMPIKERKNLPSKYHAGVDLHLLIDDFSDDHPENHECKKLLRPIVGKYAPVVLDIYQDYLLYETWDLWSQEVVYDDFCDIIYRKIESEKLATLAMVRLRNMSLAKWMQQYTSMNGFISVMNRVGKKVSRPDQLAELDRQILPIHQELMESFVRFFPSMQEAAKKYSERHSV